MARRYMYREMIHVPMNIIIVKDYTCFSFIQILTSHADIHQGSTIALQTSIRYNWLGCSPYCKAYRCPRMYFDYSDWSQCRGEVFRIYRSAGPGSIRVGDYVGLTGTISLPFGIRISWWVDQDSCICHSRYWDSLANHL